MCSCNCQNVKHLCCNTVISNTITYAENVLTINIPAGSYNNCEIYNLIVAQNIPTDTTIGSLVVITIGDGAVTYPLLRCNGAQATVYNIAPRTRYRVKVVTNTTGGSFQMLGKSCCTHAQTLPAIDGTAPAE